jgi:hypothetical protein
MFLDQRIGGERNQKLQSIELRNGLQISRVYAVPE